jgi:hypothetical protein
MLQLQIETLQWVQNKKKKEENNLESLKQVIDFKVKRLEYELKIARRDIEHTSKVVYQLEMLECCKIIINCDLQRTKRTTTTTTTTTKEDSISAFC